MSDTFMHTFTYMLCMLLHCVQAGIYDFDVFLGYRQKTEAQLVELMYHKLTNEYGLSVFLDKFNLEPGCSWETGFEIGLARSTVAVFLISKSSLADMRTMNPQDDDNCLLEHTLAMELAIAGVTQAIFPVFIGSKKKTLDAATNRPVEQYMDFFQEQSVPNDLPHFVPRKVVTKLAKVLNHELQMKPSNDLYKRTVDDTIRMLIRNPGAPVVGPVTGNTVDNVVRAISETVDDLAAAAERAEAGRESDFGRWQDKIVCRLGQMDPVTFIIRPRKQENIVGERDLFSSHNFSSCA